MNEYLITAEVTFVVTANTPDEAKALLTDNQEFDFFTVENITQVEEADE